MGKASKLAFPFNPTPPPNKGGLLTGAALFVAHELANLMSRGRWLVPGAGQFGSCLDHIGAFTDMVHRSA